MQMEKFNDTGSGAVGIGAKGTIVSLMEKELQLERRYKLQHHLPVRSEAVSVSCGNMLIATTGCRNLQVDSFPKSGSCREPFYVREEVLAKSSSVRDSRSRSDTLALPPSGTPGRRKKLVSYHDASSSGVLSFLDKEQASSVREHKKHKPVEDSVPILSPDKKFHHSLPSPSKFFAGSHVQVVDTRCYRGGRELFRQSSSSSPRRSLSFLRL